MPGRRHQKTTGVQSEGWGCRSVSMVTFANYSVFSGGGACHTPQRGADVESSATQPRGGGPQTCVHSAGGRGGERQRVCQHLQVSAQVLLSETGVQSVVSDVYTCGVSGYSKHCQATGLSSLTTYHYRIRTTIDSKHGPWSQPIEITTTSVLL